MTDPAQRTAARVVGGAYLLAMVTAIIGFSVRGHLIVAGDVAATAARIKASEHLFRLGIASDLLTFVLDIVLITALYVVLERVNRNLALLATFWRLMETAVLIVVTLNGLDVLRLLSGVDYLAAFEPNRLEALARLALSRYGGGYEVGFVFLGLGSTVFSVLWWRSRYIPRLLAGLGIVASLLLAACNFAFIIDPGLADVVGPFYMAPMGVFEVGMGLWLLVRGIVAPKPSSPSRIVP